MFLLTQKFNVPDCDKQLRSKQIDCMLLYICSALDHRWRQNVVSAKSVTQGTAKCVTDILTTFWHRFSVSKVTVKIHGNRNHLEKDVFCLMTSRGQRKNSDSPRQFEPQTFRFHALMLYHWAIKTLQSVRSITKFIWQTSCILLGSAMSIASCL